MRSLVYDNFKLAIYCAAHCLHERSDAAIGRDIEFLRKHLKLSKVYVESHRGDCSIERRRLIHLKSLFTSMGLTTAGGITPTLPENYRPGFKRMFGSICYTDPASRAKLQREVEVAASVFDEVIVDDFLFTSCTCDDCATRRGKRSWREMRLELMTEVSENVIIRPAKAVNPGVVLVIKYPNWNEAYHQTGYNTESQPGLFDAVYCGTETRDPATSQQHIARYGSYSILQWFSHLSKRGVSGAWFDALDCSTIDNYLEQAYLSVFGKAQELTLFNYSLHRDSVYVPALGFQLEKLDGFVGKLGKPVGVIAYLPQQSDGDDHLVDTLGMAGIPFELTPHFPSAPSDAALFLPAAAAADPALVTQLRSYLAAGGTVVITSGLLSRLGRAVTEEFTSLEVTEHANLVHSYGIRTNSCTFDAFQPAHTTTSFPVLRYATNATWPLIVGFSGANNIPVLAWDNVGRGKLYTLSVPANPVDLLNLPNAVLDEVRNAFAQTLPVRLKGPAEVGLFVYDNDTFVIESFACTPRSWTICLDGCVELRPLDAVAPVVSPLFVATSNVSEFELRLAPGTFRCFQVVRDEASLAK